MKNHIDVLTVTAGVGPELKQRLNDMLKPNDKIISVCSTAPKTFLVVVHRNVSGITIKRVFRETETKE